LPAAPELGSIDARPVNVSTVVGGHVVLLGRKAADLQHVVAEHCQQLGLALNLIWVLAEDHRTHPQAAVLAHTASLATFAPRTHLVSKIGHLRRTKAGTELTDVPGSVRSRSSDLT
jgi:hypothetical protein